MNTLQATLPTQMTVAEASQPGGPDVLKLATRPLPTPAAGEVLIQVAAAGVNRADCMQRAGNYPPPPGASDLLGLEVAGLVVDTGDDVTTWHPGDAVCALTNGGGYAQYIAVPAGQCLPVPRGLDWVQAAALPETCFTVWTNVFERAHLAAGEIFLVHGGSSGIGTTAIQLARLFGARAWATAGNADKVAACELLGAERCINYRTEDFVAVVKELSNGHGVDVILDMVGGDYLPRNIDALAFDGRLVMLALPRGRSAELDMGKVIARRLVISGSGLRVMSTAAKAAIATQLRERVWPLIVSGQFHPVIQSRFALADAAKAHRAMEEGEHIGKIMLEVDLSLALPSQA